jgi:lysozyme
MMNQNTEVSLAKKVIQFEEGFRSKPYYCTKGYPTIGWGHVIGKKGDPLPDIEWTKEQALAALDKHLVIGVSELSKHKVIKDIYSALNDDRQAILISMWYQLGIGKLAGFNNTLKALGSSNFDLAAKEMLDSQVARECVKRWHRQSKAMSSGSVASSYKI